MSVSDCTSTSGLSYWLWWVMFLGSVRVSCESLAWLVKPWDIRPAELQEFVSRRSLRATAPVVRCFTSGSISVSLCERLKPPLVVLI